eukprot:gene2690-3886_t
MEEEVVEQTPTAPVNEEEIEISNEPENTFEEPQTEEIIPSAPETKKEEEEETKQDENIEPNSKTKDVVDKIDEKEVEGSLKSVELKKVVEDQSEENQSEEEPFTGFSFDMSKQKPINELSMQDLFLWRNVYLSLFLFVAGHAVYALLTKYDYSVTTLIGRIMMGQILVFILLLFGYRHYKGQEAHDEASEQLNSTFKLSEEFIIPIIKKFIRRFNNTLHSYNQILLLVDLPKTLKFFGLLQLICFLGNRISGVTLLYMVFLYSFTIPKIYEMKQQEIDDLFEKMTIKLKEQSVKIIDKLPPNVKIHVEKFVKVKND